jgi:hypothetical protein
LTEEGYNKRRKEERGKRREEREERKEKREERMENTLICMWN